MTIPPSDQVLRAALTLRQRGSPMAPALRRGTRVVLARMNARSRRTGSVWKQLYMRSLRAHPRGVEPEVLDAAFRHIFHLVGRGQWPKASQLSTLVASQIAAGASPSAAVQAGLAILDQQRVMNQMVQQWCRLGKALYRPDQVLPFLRPSLVPAPHIPQILRLESLATWVVRRIAYQSDHRKWGCPDFWQSPLWTLWDGTGDCEDMSLVLWSAARWVGLPPGRLAIGTYNGEGHAWVEFHEVGLWAEATSGTVGRLGWGPSPYRAALYVYPSRCELAVGCS